MHPERPWTLRVRRSLALTTLTVLCLTEERQQRGWGIYQLKLGACLRHVLRFRRGSMTRPAAAARGRNGDRSARPPVGRGAVAAGPGRRGAPRTPPRSRSARTSGSAPLSSRVSSLSSSCQSVLIRSLLLLHGWSPQQFSAQYRDRLPGEAHAV